MLWDQTSVSLRLCGNHTNYTSRETDGTRKSAALFCSVQFAFFTPPFSAVGENRPSTLQLLSRPPKRSFLVKSTVELHACLVCRPGTFQHNNVCRRVTKLPSSSLCSSVQPPVAFCVIGTNTTPPPVPRHSTYALPWEKDTVLHSYGTTEVRTLWFDVSRYLRFVRQLQVTSSVLCRDLRL
jgi:hypothetical protein